MNDQVLDRARSAYRAGDFATAAQMFSAAKDPNEVSGEVDHLLGNSLMRLGRYAEAAQAYASALSDTSYGKQGALLTNRGKALVATGDLQAAADSFTAATKDASYATPYKAYLGLGSALEKLGNMTDAGVAFRQAAIDGTNPAPAGALASLGACFVALGRPEDAIEAYRTALDFATPRDDARAINAGLGRAYTASNRFSDAVDAFQRATADGIYQLTAEQQADLDHAKQTLSSAAASLAPAVGNGYTNGVDPLDPLGQSGNFMPDPSDTGFFTLSESEMIQQDKQDMKVRRKHRHTGLKIFIVLLLLVLIAAGGLGFLYTRGYGYPTQQDVLTKLFTAATDGTDASSYLNKGLSDDQKNVLISSIPANSTPTIEAMDKNMTTSTAKVKVALSKGGEMTYQVRFDRDGIGWVVSELTPDFSNVGADSDAGATDTADTTGATDTTDVSGDQGASTGTDTATDTGDSADTGTTDGTDDQSSADGTADGAASDVQNGDSSAQ